jgi:hypothetical protein
MTDQQTINTSTSTVSISSGIASTSSGDNSETKIDQPQNEQLFVFSGKAYKKLIELSTKLKKTPDQILLTGMKLLDLSENGKIIVEKNGKSYDVDIEKL